MLAPIRAVLPRVKTTLDTIPLYTQQSKLNRDNPDPPYSLMVPISQPEDPDKFDAVLIAGLDIWGPLWRLEEIAGALEWLDGHQIGTYGEDLTIQNIRYTRQGRTIFREPGAMIDETTELWHLSDSYRMRYAYFPALGVVP